MYFNKLHLIKMAIININWYYSLTFVASMDKKKTDSELLITD